MAVDMFLKLEGIKGESRDADHKDQIEVLSWSWGATQQGKAGSMSGASKGKVDVQDLSISKYMDSSSPNLFLYCCNAKHIPTATLSCNKASGDSVVEYLKLEMKEVIISSYSTSHANGADDLPMESVSLNFASINDIYTKQTEKGEKGDVVTAGWDIAQNKKI